MGIVAVAALVTGCGSRSGGGAATGAGGGNTIKIMAVSTWDTGQLDFGDLPIIDQIAAEAVNARGGINGAKVQVVVCNDKFDPNQAESCARQAVQDKVVALVGGISLFTARMFPILDQAKIPWIGNYPLGGPDSTSAYSFPVTPGSLHTFGMGYLAAQQCKAPVIITNQNEAAATVPWATAGAKAAGRQIAGTILVPPTATDYSTYIAQAQQMHADCLVGGVIESSMFQLIPAMKAAGYSPRLYGSESGGITPALIDR
jgi:ABC-type branched-subunit amino acid transport system substrate-binding protein